MNNILVAIELEEQDRLIIKKAVQLAEPYNSKIWLVHVAAPDPDFVGYEPGPQYIRDYRAAELRGEHKQLQNYAKELRKKEINADALLIQGATTKMIIDEAKKLKADLIITGHHNRSFIYRALFTNVTNAIVKQSNIPILIVPV